MTPRLASLLLLASACTIRGHDGDLAEGEEAVIVSHCAGAVYVRILEIDGKEIDRDWYQGGTLELAPGYHRIVLDVTWKALDRTAWLSWGPLTWLAVNAATARDASVDIGVNVKPGRRYVFTASVTSRDMPTSELVDAETDELVAGHRRSGLLALEE